MKQKLRTDLSRPNNQTGLTCDITHPSQLAPRTCTCTYIFRRIICTSQFRTHAHTHNLFHAHPSTHAGISKSCLYYTHVHNILTLPFFFQKIGRLDRADVLKTWAECYNNAYIDIPIISDRLEGLPLSKRAPCGLWSYSFGLKIYSLGYRLDWDG